MAYDDIYRVVFLRVSEVGYDFLGGTVVHGIMEFLFIFFFLYVSVIVFSVGAPGSCAVDGFSVEGKPLTESFQSGAGQSGESSFAVRSDIQQQVAALAYNVCQMAYHDIRFLVDGVIAVIAPVFTHGQAGFPRSVIYLAGQFLFHYAIVSHSVSDTAVDEALGL